jgi:hypothetical protein
MITVSKPLLLAAPDAAQSLEFPRIGWDTITRDLLPSAVSASSDTQTGPADAVLRDDTAEYWLPNTLPATLTIDFGRLEDVDYVGVAGHTLGSSACSLKLETSMDGVTFAQFGLDYVAADDSAQMFLDTVRQARLLRLSVSGAAAPKIAVVYVGKVLVMEKRVTGGYVPITMARNTVKRNQVSRGGQFVSTSIRRMGVDGTATFEHLSSSFVRNSFDPFVKSARTFPYFFAWNPLTFPLEVAYCWTDKDIRPAYEGIIDLMRVSWNMQGLGVK